MKKMILVLMVVLTLGMVGKGLYTALAKLDTNRDVAMGYALVDDYPSAMPDMVVDPATGYALF